jgi:hypothetical protein
MRVSLTLVAGDLTVSARSAAMVLSWMGAAVAGMIYLTWKVHGRKASSISSAEESSDILIETISSRARKPGATWGTPLLEFLEPFGRVVYSQDIILK